MHMFFPFTQAKTESHKADARFGSFKIMLSIDQWGSRNCKTMLLNIWKQILIGKKVIKGQRNASKKGAVARRNLDWIYMFMKSARRLRVATKHFFAALFLWRYAEACNL